MNEIDQKYGNFYSKSFVKFVEMTMISCVTRL